MVEVHQVAVARQAAVDEHLEAVVHPEAAVHLVDRVHQVVDGALVHPAAAAQHQSLVAAVEVEPVRQAMVEPVVVAPLVHQLEIDRTVARQIVWAVVRVVVWADRMVV